MTYMTRSDIQVEDRPAVTCCARSNASPFGGNHRSGVGAKAGGPDYLAQFVEPRVVTENTMRHGLVAE